MFTVEGKVAQWRVPPGAQVNAGDVVVEVETEKAVQEVIAPAAGILHHVAPPGAVVSEQHLLGYVLADGEAVPSPGPPPAAPAPPARGARGHEPSTARGPEERVPATAEARRLASQLGVDLSTVTGTGPRGRIVAGDVQAAASARGNDWQR
jgi:pyruvate dehydrogenase E2 component (dihydrolipoamide acetyltransferase)